MTGISTPLRLSIRFQRAEFGVIFVELKIRNKRPSGASTILPIGGLRGTASGGPLDKRRAFCAIVGTTGDTWRKPEFRVRIWRGYFRRSSTLSMVARRLSRLRLCRPTKTDGRP